MPTEPTVLSPWVRRTVRAAWVVACMGAASVPATTTVTMLFGAATPDPAVFLWSCLTWAVLGLAACMRLPS